MKDIPIIFSGPMVRALLDGRKVMTRRLRWTPAKTYPKSGAVRHFGGTTYRLTPWDHVRPGDRLWVRESFRYHSWDDDGMFWVRYLADNSVSSGLDTDDGDTAQNLMERVCGELDRKGAPRDEAGNYTDTTVLGSKPSIHMPRWASRLSLTVMSTKIERLRDISRTDAAAEGVCLPISDDVDPQSWPSWFRRNRWPEENFKALWESLHGHAAWAENPEVVALTFTVHKQNIDALPKAIAA